MVGISRELVFSAMQLNNLLNYVTGLRTISIPLLLAHILVGIPSVNFFTNPLVQNVIYSQTFVLKYRKIMYLK